MREVVNPVPVAVNVAEVADRGLEAAAFAPIAFAHVRDPEGYDVVGGLWGPSAARSRLLGFPVVPRQDREKRPLTRKQAEALAKTNPVLRKRLEAGEFDSPPPAASGRSPAATGKRRRPVSAGAPPARPAARRQTPPPERQQTATRPPRRSRDNGDPPPPKPRSAVREFFDGLFSG